VFAIVRHADIEVKQSFIQMCEFHSSEEVKQKERIKSSYKNLGDKQRAFRINIPRVLIVLPSYVGKVVFFGVV
jgi:hypothetical protein